MKLQPFEDIVYQILDCVTSLEMRGKSISQNNINTLLDKLSMPSQKNISQ